MTAAALAVAFALYLPPAGDGWRLPPRTYLRDGIEFNLRYRARLDARARHASTWGELCAVRRARAEAEELWHVWDLMVDAHPEATYYRDDTRRGFLRRLRLTLGREAYDRMELPPCVPTWRFQELE